MGIMIAVIMVRFSSTPIITTITTFTAPCKVGVVLVCCVCILRRSYGFYGILGRNLTILTILTEIIVMFFDIVCIMFCTRGYKLSS